MSPFIKHKKYIQATLVFVFIFLSFFYVSKVNPPLSSPDEIFHLARAESLMQGRIILEHPSDELSGVYVDSSYIDLENRFKFLNYDRTNRITKETISKLKDINWSGERVYFPIPNTALYFPIVYAPHAIGLGISRVLNLSIYYSYMVTRFTVFLSCIVILIASWRIYKIPSLALAVLCLPMSVFQLFSPTIDGITTSITILIMSILFNIWRNGESHHDNKKIILLCVLILIVSTCRQNLIPLCLLPAVLYFKEKKYKYLTYSLLTLIISLAWVAIVVITTRDNGVNHPDISLGEVIKHYVTHPIEMIKVIFNTATDPFFISSYTKQFIGVLGWLNIFIPSWTYKFYIITIGILFAYGFKFSKFKHDAIININIIAISLMCITLIFCALLVQFSPFPTVRVIGIQGRYFAIPVIILAYGLSVKKTKLDMGILTSMFLVSVLCIKESIYLFYF